MAEIHWDHSKFLVSTKKKALDGIEEIARGPMVTTSKENCPVDKGTARNSIGVERDDANLCCYVGGGGAAKKYFFRLHQDMAANHKVGRAKFITLSIQAHAKELPKAIEKHISG